jgi:hypothetical protein
MTTLAAFSNVTLTLGDGGYVVVSTNGGMASITAAPISGAAQTSTLGPLPARRTFGPYSEGATVTINNQAGALDYDSFAGNTGVDVAALQALVSGAGIPELSLTNNLAAPATKGTLIVDWSSGYSGGTNTLDSSPILGGALAQINSGATTAAAAANAGSQSSAMKLCGYSAMSNVRASGQAAAAVYVEFGTDGTFANNCFFAASIPCDGRWHFLTSPAQVAWGTGGTFTIGTTPFTHVRMRESASLSTNYGRAVVGASDRIVMGPMYRDPSARAFGYVRVDDCVADQYTPRQTLAADFVGKSGVTLLAGVPHSALSVLQAFDLKGTAYILTRHVGDTAASFMTASQLKDLQDTYGWCIGFQTHANPLSANNLGLRLLGNLGYTLMAVGGISSVTTATGVITAGAAHNITTTSTVAGRQGFPVTLIGSGFPVPTDGALSAGDTLWLRNVTTTTFTAHRTEADSCDNINPIIFSSAGTPANWGYRWRGSAVDSSAIAADFATGQALMQGWGLNGWRHYAPNQGAFGLETESVLLAMRAAGTLRTGSGTYASSGIAKVDYTPRIAQALIGCGPGANLTGQFGTSLNAWMTVPSNIDTHNGGTDFEATIRAYVDDCVSRGAICGNYHHHFSTQASLRNFVVYCDQLRMRADQGLMELGTMDDLYGALVAAGTA